MAIAPRTKLYDNLITTLNQVRISGGYENDATGEGQASRGNRLEDRNLLVIDNGDSPVADSPVNADDFNASFTVNCFVAVSDATVAQPYPPELQQLVAEVRKALNEDYTRGGNAINTITGADAPIANDGVPGRAVEVTIHYRTNKDDPTSYGD